MTQNNLHPLFELRYFDVKNRFDVILEFILIPLLMIYNIWSIIRNDIMFALWNCLAILLYLYVRNIYCNIKTPILEIRSEYIVYRKYPKGITTVIPKSSITEIVVKYGFLKIQTAEGKPHSIAIPAKFRESCKETISRYFNSPAA